MRLLTVDGQVACWLGIALLAYGHMVSLPGQMMAGQLVQDMQVKVATLPLFRHLTRKHLKARHAAGKRLTHVSMHHQHQAHDSVASHSVSTVRRGQPAAAHQR